MCKHYHKCGNSDETKEIKLLIITVCIALAAFSLKSDILFIAAYIIAGCDIIFASIKNIFKGKIFDENFLMSTAATGAAFLHEFPEAISVMVLYKLGEYLQKKALNKSENSIKELIDITPKYANVETDGVIIQTFPDKVKINDIIIVKPGEKIPSDGTITEGSSFIDTSSLTGESTPKELHTGETVLSGCINLNGTLKIKVTKEYKESTAAKILELIENAQTKKAKTEKFITKFAVYYTPCVVITALIIAVIPFVLHLNPHTWITRALTFLVISCPCALVISVPLTFFCAIGAASKQGILLKGSSYIEKLADPGIIAFDKTGTLTKGNFSVTNIKSFNGESTEDILKDAAYAEYYSNHPIAKAIKDKFNGYIDISKISNTKEIAGSGIFAELNKNKIIIGNKKFIEKNGYHIEDNENSTTVYLVKNSVLTGAITAEDELKPQTKELISKLDDLKIRTVMLTGDTYSNAWRIANEAGIKEFYADLLPRYKVEKLEELIKTNTSGKSIIFTGDGINDAPVLIRSDIGIAMGALGSDAAIEAADIVISDDNILKIYYAVLLAKKTVKTAKQNIIFAIGVKILFLALSVFGFMTIWGAVFADTGVALIAVINAMQCSKINGYRIFNG